MNYLKPELRDALAASYVLGTLRGAARQRFEKLMMRYESLRQATWYWEQQLNQWSHALPPVQPPASVWTGIDAQINASPKTMTDSAPATIWKWISGIAVAAALLLAVILIQPASQRPVTSDYIAVMSATDDTPLWLIEIKDRKLTIRPTAELPQLPHNDYELWIVPADDNNPISLGVLAQINIASILLSHNISISNINALAVSKEAKGGSASGTPTEVLYLSPLTQVAG